MKIMLINDTGTEPHLGCQGVSNAHVVMLAQLGYVVKYRYFVGQLAHYFCGNEADSIKSVLNDHDFIKRLEEVDAVVVNGEGTIHHGFGLQYLAVLGAAQRLGKKTLLINAVFEESYGFENVLRQLDDFCVREASSAEFAASLGVECRILPDSFLEAQFDNSVEPFIDLTGKVVVTDWHFARDLDCGKTMMSYLYDNIDRSFYFPLLHEVHRQTWKSSLRMLSNCDFIITGRHHGIYLAVAARKPFVALPSNSHKIEGLIKWSGLPIPVCSNPTELQAGIAFCKRNPTVYDEFFAFLDSFRPLSTFMALGKDDVRVDVSEELGKMEGDINQHLNQPSVKRPLSSEDYQRQLATGTFDFLKSTVNKRIVLFGTGSTSETLVNKFPLPVAYCVDNNPQKNGTWFKGLPVKSPENLLNEEKDELLIIIASQFYKEISAQLNEMGFIENIHFRNGFPLS